MTSYACASADASRLSSLVPAASGGWFVATRTHAVRRACQARQGRATSSSSTDRRRHAQDTTGRRADCSLRLNDSSASPSLLTAAFNGGDSPLPGRRVVVTKWKYCRNLIDSWTAKVKGHAHARLGVTPPQAQVPPNVAGPRPAGCHAKPSVGATFDLEVSIKLRQYSYYAPPLYGGGIKRWCASDVWCLSVWRLSVAYIGPKSTTERPRKT